MRHAGGSSCGMTRPTTGPRGVCPPRCGRPRTRCTGTCARPTRSSTGRTARRRRRRAARRSTRGRRSCAGLAARRRTRSWARWSTPASATSCRSTSSGPYMRSMRVDCGPVRIRDLGRARRATWTARPARSAGSWRRCSACPSAFTPTSGASARRSSSPTSSATCARTGELDRIYLPGRGPRAPRRGGGGLQPPPRHARRCARWSPSRSAVRVRCSRPPSRRSPPRPRSVRSGIRLACAAYGRILDRAEAARRRRARPPRRHPRPRPSRRAGGGAPR